MAVVPRRSGDEVLASLINSGYTATYSETRGGMLRQSQLTLFIAVRTSDLQNVLDIINSACTGETVIHRGYGLTISGDVDEPHLTNEGKKLGHSGAVVFIWTLDRYELP
ncbi:MAG: cyclic-di-AMP receptor [Anaerolineaceae bacterium]|nr:cyclic-di-AMP receptor [Anaerolineaceae bacterium]MDD4043629.1 cyclic-di-AMP receptor [Anaerolineaceae bacterium]MDD4577598.1 cyclic-di-AMP receptor [Anaerolineaceae bacterium]